MEVTCVSCGVRGEVKGRPDKYAFFKRKDHDSWAYHGGTDLSALGTHPYRLVSRTDGVFRFGNPEYNSKAKPLIIDLWLCPECENAILCKTFEEVAEKARKLYSDALNARKRPAESQSHR